MVLLIAIAYTTATMQGRKIKLMGIQKYIGRLKEAGRNERRHSSFYIGLYGQTQSICRAMRRRSSGVNDTYRNKRKYYRVWVCYGAYPVYIIAFVAPPAR